MLCVLNALRGCRSWVLGGLLLLSACSGTNFVYNQLDLLLHWYVGNYVDLTRDQKKYLDQLLAPFLSWHRTEELPRYLTLLQRFDDSLDKPQTPAGIAAIFVEVEQAGLRLEGRALDGLLDLGARLSDEQIAGFLEEMWEHQHDYEEKYLTRTDEEFAEDNYDDLKDWAVDYLGVLSDAQRTLLRDASRRLLRSDRAWLQENAGWITQLTGLLQRTAGWQQRIREAVVARNKNIPPEFGRIYQHNMDVLCELIAQLLNGRSERQDRHLRDKLAGLREDLNILMAQGEEPQLSPPG